MNNIWDYVNQGYTVVQCASVDLKTRDSISYVLESMYRVKERIRTKESFPMVGMISVDSPVITLFTKLKAGDKPTKSSMELCLTVMAVYCKRKGLTKFVLPVFDGMLDGIPLDFINDKMSELFTDMKIECKIINFLPFKVGIYEIS